MKDRGKAMHVRTPLWQRTQESARFFSYELNMRITGSDVLEVMRAIAMEDPNLKSKILEHVIKNNSIDSDDFQRQMEERVVDTQIRQGEDIDRRANQGEY